MPKPSILELFKCFILLTFFSISTQAQSVSCIGSNEIRVEVGTCSAKVQPSSFGIGGDVLVIEGLPEVSMINNGTAEVTLDMSFVPEFISEGKVVDLTYNLLAGDAENPTNSCWGTFTILDQPGSKCGSPILSGIVFSDVNQNDIYDNTEVGLENVQVLHLPDSTVSYTDKNGKYKFFRNEGYNKVEMFGVESCNAEFQEYEVISDTIVGDYEQNFPIFISNEEVNAELSIESGPTRCGFTVPFFVNVFNSGCQEISGEVVLDIDELVLPTNGPEELNIEFDKIPPQASFRKKINFTIANEEFVGDTIKIKANLSGPSISSNYEFKSELRCAIDPNDKAVSPVVIDPDSTLYSLLEDEVIYKIRFQNEGNDTAFNVRIEDTISQSLDMSTFRPINASHDYRVEITDGNAISYFFDDILLPYKTIDEPGSNGYFTFGIRPIERLDEFTEVENTAHIYFDFNKAVITNTVKHIFVTTVDEDEDGYYFWEDCEDKNQSINPGAEDIPYNDIDENCDGTDLEIDEDGDGYNSLVDCDDIDSTINPSAIDIPYNEVDENCDGLDAEVDEDEDGFNSLLDCDDQNAQINPGAEDIPYNDIDENCDGMDAEIDEDLDGFNSILDCDDQNAQINPGVVEIVNNDVDEDCDGVAQIVDVDGDGFNSDDDCDDNNATIFPGAPEIANNQIDENCDGIAFIIDEDEDGFNSEEDCNDQDPAINPDAEEILDNAEDENCDGVAEITSSTLDAINQNLRIFPIPVGEILYIDNENNEQLNASFMNISGRIVASVVLNKGLNSFETADLPNGIYMIRISSKNSSKISYKKIVVHHSS